MVCAYVRAIMHSLALVHHRYIHTHNHGTCISKIYETAFILRLIDNAGDGGLEVKIYYIQNMAFLS